MLLKKPLASYETKFQLLETGTARIGGLSRVSGIEAQPLLHSRVNGSYTFFSAHLPMMHFLECPEPYATTG
jgi:hypothetical protein